MKKIIAATLLALLGAVPTRAQFCSNCILNTAAPQNAQINIGTATIRGTLTVQDLVAAALDITGDLTVGTITGDGSHLTVLNAAALSSGTVPSARVSGPYTGITGLGTVTAGTWNAGVMASSFGGTGANLGTSVVGAIPYFSSVGTMSALSPTTAGFLLQTNGGGSPSWTGAPAVLGTNVTAIPMANLTPGDLPTNIAVKDASISSLSAAKVVGDITGNSTNINGTLALTKLAAGTLVDTIVASSITPTGVAPGIWGGPAKLLQMTIRSDGRISAISDSTYTVAASSVGAGTLPSDVFLLAANVLSGSLGSSVIASSLTATGVTAGSYGSAAQTPTLVVQGDGRITAASQQPIALPLSQLNAGTIPSNVLVPAANIQPGSLGTTVIASSVAANGVVAGTYGNQAAVPQFTVAADGRIMSATQYSIPALSTTVAHYDQNNYWAVPQTSSASWIIFNTLSATSLSGSHIGDGNGLTNLNPASLASGALFSGVTVTEPQVVGLTSDFVSVGASTAALQAQKVNRAGDTMTGALLLPSIGISTTPQSNERFIAQKYFEDSLSTDTVLMMDDATETDIIARAEGTDFGAISTIKSSAYGGGNGATASFIGLAAEGLKATPSATLSGDNVFIGAKGYNSAAETGSKASISLAASENWTTTANGMNMTFGVTKAGTTAKKSVMKLDENGLTMLTSSGYQNAIAATTVTASAFTTSAPGGPVIEPRFVGSPDFQVSITSDGVSPRQVAVNTQAGAYDLLEVPHGIVIDLDPLKASSAAVVAIHSGYIGGPILEWDMQSGGGSPNDNSLAFFSPTCSTCSVVFGQDGSARSVSSMTASAFFGDGSHLGGVNLNTDVSSHTFKAQVEIDSGTYYNVTSATEAYAFALAFSTPNATYPRIAMNTMGVQVQVANSSYTWEPGWSVLVSTSGSNSPFGVIDSTTSTGSSTQLAHFLIPRAFFYKDGMAMNFTFDTVSNVPSGAWGSYVEVCGGPLLHWSTTTSFTGSVRTVHFELVRFSADQYLASGTSVDANNNAYALQVNSGTFPGIQFCTNPATVEVDFFSSGGGGQGSANLNYARAWAQ